jgi:hypothetical protein
MEEADPALSEEISLTIFKVLTLIWPTYMLRVREHIYCGCYELVHLCTAIEEADPVFFGRNLLHNVHVLCSWSEQSIALGPWAFFSTSNVVGENLCLVMEEADPATFGRNFLDNFQVFGSCSDHQGYLKFILLVSHGGG